MFLFMFSWVICNILITICLRLTLRLESNIQIPSPWVPLLTHILTIFIVVPFLLGFPGKSHSYTDFLSDIRLTKVKPLLSLILLGLTCYLILSLSQAAGVLVYRLTLGLPVDWSFIRSAFVLANELPPRSTSWLQSFPSIFEEVAWVTANLGMGGIGSLALRIVKSLMNNCSMMDQSIWTVVSLWTAVVAGSVLGLLLNLISESWSVRHDYRAWSILAFGEGEVTTPSWRKPWWWILLSLSVLVGGFLID